MRKLALIALMILFAAGCGSSDDGSTTSSSETAGSTQPDNAPTPTKAELIKQADAICDRTDKVQETELKIYLKKNPQAQSTEAGQSEMVLAVGLPPIQTEVDELRALGAPSGDEDEVAAIFDGIEKATEEAEGKPSSVLGEKGNPFLAVNKLAAEYGFKACANAL